MRWQKNPQDEFARLVEDVRTGLIERYQRQGGRMRSIPTKLDMDLSQVPVFFRRRFFDMSDSIFHKTREQRDGFVGLLASGAFRLPYPTMILMGFMEHDEDGVPRVIPDPDGGKPITTHEHCSVVYLNQSTDAELVTGHMLMSSEGNRWKIHPFSLTMLLGAYTTLNGEDEFNFDDHIDIAPDPAANLTASDRAGVERGAAAIFASAVYYSHRIVSGSGKITYADAGPLSQRISERRERLHLLPVSRVRIIELDPHAVTRAQSLPRIGEPAFRMPTHYRRGTYVHFKSGRVTWRRSTIVNEHLGALPPPPPWYDLRG